MTTASLLSLPLSCLQMHENEGGGEDKGIWGQKWNNINIVATMLLLLLSYLWIHENEGGVMTRVCKDEGNDVVAIAWGEQCHWHHWCHCCFIRHRKMRVPEGEGESNGVVIIIAAMSSGMQEQEQGQRWWQQPERWGWWQQQHQHCCMRATALSLSLLLLSCCQACENKDK